MHSINLKDIIDGCRKEDTKQQEILFNTYSRVLFSICCRYTGDRDDAEDVLQETFIRIYKNIRQYKETGSFEGWMKSIAVHCSLRFLRTKKKIKFENIEHREIADTVEEEIEEEIDPKFLVDCINK